MIAPVCQAEDRLFPNATGAHSTARPRHGRSTHTAALGDVGERTGVAPELGERRAAKNHYPALDFGGYKLDFKSTTTVLLGQRSAGRAVNSGHLKLGFKSPALTFFFSKSESPGPSFSGVQASPTVGYRRLLSAFGCFCMGLGHLFRKVFENRIFHPKLCFLRAFTCATPGVQPNFALALLRVLAILW